MESPAASENNGLSPGARKMFQHALNAHRAGHFATARNGYLAVLAEDRQHVDSLRLLSIALHQSGSSEEALVLARGALSLRQDAASWSALGGIARDTQRYEEAENAFRRALELAPIDSIVLNDLALVLSKRGQLDEAERCYRQAIEHNPEHADAHNNLGVLLKRTGRPDAAAAAYRRALQVRPDYPQAHNNLGVLYKESGRLAEAEIDYRRAIELKPDYADACWNLGLVLLELGRYHEAWPYYEARHHPLRTEAISPKPELPYPQWQGEALDGKSLIVWTEQGHGDYIHFARYLPLLKQRGLTRLTVACAPPLRDLLATIAGVDALITHRHDVPRHDFWVFPMSLPMHFETAIDTIPATLPYLHAPLERLAKWQTRISGSRLKVGLVWKGNPGHANDRQRSLPHLSTLAPLWGVTDIDFYSLQKGAGEDEISAAPHVQPITAVAQDIDDFADSAAIIAGLDLVICVDTAIAHLCGALARPCWVLIQHSGHDWRWLQGRNDSPWYPGVMRLFRQAVPERWEETVAELTRELQVWRDAQRPPAALPTAS